MEHKSREKKQQKSSRNSLVNIRSTKSKENCILNNAAIPSDLQTASACPLSSIPTELNQHSLLCSSFKSKNLINEKKKSLKKKTLAPKSFEHSSVNDHFKHDVCPLEISSSNVTSKSNAALKKRDYFTEGNLATRHVLPQPKSKQYSNKLPLSVNPKIFSKDKILKKDSVNGSFLKLAMISQNFLNSLSEVYSELESRKEECSCKRVGNYASTPRGVQEQRAFKELKLSPINSCDQINANTVNSEISCNEFNSFSEERESSEAVNDGRRVNNSCVTRTNILQRSGNPKESIFLNTSVETGLSKKHNLDSHSETTNDEMASSTSSSDLLPIRRRNKNRFALPLDSEDEYEVEKSCHTESNIIAPAKSRNPIKAARHSKVSHREVTRTKKKNKRKSKNSNMESTEKPQVSRKSGKSLKTVHSIKKCRPKPPRETTKEEMYSYGDNCKILRQSRDEADECWSLSSSTEKEKSKVPVSRQKIPVGYQNKLLSSDMNTSLSDYELEGEAEGITSIPEESTAAKICREMKLFEKHSVVEDKTSKRPYATASRGKDYLKKLELRKKQKTSNKTAAYREEMAPPKNLFHCQTSSEKAVKQGTVNMQSCCVSKLNNSIPSPKSKPIFFKKKNFSIEHPTARTECSQNDSSVTSTFARTANLKQFKSLKKFKSELPKHVSAKNPSTKFSKAHVAHKKSNTEKAARKSKSSNQTSNKKLAKVVKSGNCRHDDEFQDPCENETLIHSGDRHIPNYPNGSKVTTGQQCDIQSKERSSLKTAKGSRCKATKTLSRKVWPQEKNTTSVEKHSSTLGNVRRSTRTRRRPLSTWCNERARYRVLENGDIIFVDIAM